MFGGSREKNKSRTRRRTRRGGKRWEKKKERNEKHKTNKAKVLLGAMHRRRLKAKRTPARHTPVSCSLNRATRRTRKMNEDDQQTKQRKQNKTRADEFTQCEIHRKVSLNL